jgi:hypothetical protein
LLGNKRILDQRGGDAGCLYKSAEIVPRIFFIRASLIAPYNSIMAHPELKSMGKTLKQFYVTSSLGIAYENGFCTDIYNIQRPSKDNIHTDHSLDYFQKVIQQRRINSKKKQEKTLASLINSVAQSSSESTYKQSFERMKSNMKEPARKFQVPYMITAMAVYVSEEER